VIGCLLIVMLTGCVPYSSPPPPPPPPSSIPPSSDLTTSNTEATPMPLAPKPTPNPPLNVTINYFGVRNAYGGNVQLVVIVSDGDRMEKHLIPDIEGGFSMGNFETKRLNQRVFHTPSAKGDLKVNIVAYHRDQSKKDYLALIEMMEWYYGDSITMLKNLILNMPQNDKIIGYYEHKWYSNESWGIGQHNGVGVDNLQVWFSIWSTSEPTPVTQPVILPKVRIRNVIIPNTISLGVWGNKSEKHILTLENNEDFDVKLDYVANSSVTGNFDDGTITVPRNSFKDVVKTFIYNKKGTARITYTIYYNNNELDKWSGGVTVTP